ncbi:hypothetical protein PFISCL1PPCAC_7340, partial [Pristionchus fissidentatus]
SLQEKEETLSRVRDQNEADLKILRRKHEEKEKQFRNEISEIQEKRIEQASKHTEQILALAQKAEEIRATMHEKLLVSQQEASDYLLAQKKAHLNSMAMAYVIMGATPRSIQADK